MKKIGEHLFADKSYNCEVTPIVNKFEPIEVDLWVEIQTIHEININRGYMDATISLDMLWHDQRLTWDSDLFGKLGMTCNLKSQNISSSSGILTRHTIAIMSGKINIVQTPIIFGPLMSKFKIEFTIFNELTKCHNRHRQGFK